MCRVTIDGETRLYAEGTAYQEIAEEYQPRYEHQIVLVFVGKYRLRELRKCVEEDCELRFVTTGDPIGHATYKRSMCLLLVKAVHDVAGPDQTERVRLHFFVDKGYFCTVGGGVEFTQEFFGESGARLREVSPENVPTD